MRPSGKGALLSGLWPLGGALPRGWVSGSYRPRHPPGLGLPWDPASPPIPSHPIPYRPPPPTSEVGRLRGQTGPLIVPFLLLLGRVSRRPLGPTGGKGARLWCLDAIAAGAGKPRQKPERAACEPDQLEMGDLENAILRSLRRLSRHLGGVAFVQGLFAVAGCNFWRDWNLATLLCRVRISRMHQGFIFQTFGLGKR